VVTLVPVELEVPEAVMEIYSPMVVLVAATGLRQLTVEAQETLALAVMALAAVADLAAVAAMVEQVLPR
jgi:hypothetical protein